MTPFLNAILFLGWVCVYLAAVSWLARHRRKRRHGGGIGIRDVYRADRDPGLWFLVFLIGVVLLVGVFLALRMISGLA